MAGKVRLVEEQDMMSTLGQKRRRDAPGWTTSNHNDVGVQSVPRGHKDPNCSMSSAIKKWTLSARGGQRSGR